MSDIVRHIKFLKAAYTLAAKSPDPSTQNGAVIVDESDRIIGEGCNVFPEGVIESDDRWERPLKYKFIEHAERSAVYDAAKRGNPTNGLTMYCPWSACSDCARAIIRSGIKTLVGHEGIRAKVRKDDKWLHEIAIADQMFKEAGVEVILVDAFLNSEPVRFEGNLWTP